MVHCLRFAVHGSRLAERKRGGARKGVRERERERERDTGTGERRRRRRARGDRDIGEREGTQGQAESVWTQDQGGEGSGREDSTRFSVPSSRFMIRSS